VPEFYELWPEKFINVTNGITPRRWLLHANHELADFLCQKLGTDWITDLDLLRNLEKYVNNESFIKEFRRIKRDNKKRLVQHVYKTTRVMINKDSMYIVHAKRIHEYKRQLMTILQVIGEYLAITRDNVRPTTPKTYIFAGKAAPSYTFAKLVIKLINNVADVINNDEKASPFLKVVFIPDYKVSVAEYLIPAADLNCQISTAGFEASGTSNMKFALNASLTVGTYDGANIEIYDAVGADNFYLFGLTEEQIRSRRMTYNPREIYERSEYIKRILNSLNSTQFADENYPQLFRPIFDSLLNNDYYFVLADLEAFNKAIQQAAADYIDRDAWAKKALMNMSRIGYFSSDRSVMEYAKNIWHVEPVESEED
jgi:starch phosphorylase